MLRNNLSKVTLVFAIIALFFSCKKDNIEPQPKPQASKIKATVENGILTFATSDDFFEATELMQEMSMEEIQAWEKSIGFESYETYVEGILTQTDNAESMEEVYNIVNKYSSFVEVKDSMVTPKVIVCSYRKIMNKDGFYIVEEALHKITPEEIIISYKGNKNDIDNALAGLKSDETDLFRSKYILSNTKSYLKNIEAYGVKTIKNERLHASIIYHITIANNLVRYQVRIETTSNCKGVFWRRYNTTHRWDRYGFKVFQPIRINNRNIETDYLEYDYKTRVFSSSDVSYFSRTHTIYSYYSSSVTPINHANAVIRCWNNSDSRDFFGQFHIRPFNSEVLTLNTIPTN